MLPSQSKTLASNSQRIAHGFFGRAGGVSTGIYAWLNCGAGSRDDAANVVENKRRVCESLSADELVTLAQIHSNHAIVIPAKAGIQNETALDPAVKPRGDASGSEADALVTNQPNIALGILTADCGPVLFADPEAGVIGAAHAGWKGAQSGVLENTIAAMEKLGAVRANIIAALGPTIAQASYEVGPEFLERFDSEEQQRFFTNQHFNLPAYICHRLAQSGVTSVEDLAIDTYTNEQDYFSYRRCTHSQEPDYGRQISAIMLKA